MVGSGCRPLADLLGGATLGRPISGSPDELEVLFCRWRKSMMTLIWESDAVMCQLSRDMGADSWPHDDRQIEITRSSSLMCAAGMMG
jgi:hypothetical protein